MAENNKDAGTQARPRVIYSMMVSLDGFIEGPDHKIDWITIDEELHRYANAQERGAGALLYGRRMYEVMSYWQTADTIPGSLDFEVEYAHIWQSLPKIVFSKTLERVEGNATLVRDISAEEITRLKEQFGGDLHIGGAGIASTFFRLGLIDEVGLFVQPVTLGSGKPFFPASDRKIDMRLVETRNFGSGVVYLGYQLAGKE